MPPSTSSRVPASTLGRVPVGEQWIDIDLHGGTVVALGRESDTGLVYAAAYRIVIPTAVLAAAAAALN